MIQGGIYVSMFYFFLFYFRAVNGVPGDDSPAEKISFVYIPSHLYHIMFELVDLIEFYIIAQT